MITGGNNFRLVQNVFQLMHVNIVTFNYGDVPSTKKIRNQTTWNLFCLIFNFYYWQHIGPNQLLRHSKQWYEINLIYIHQQSWLLNLVSVLSVKNNKYLEEHLSYLQDPLRVMKAKVPGNKTAKITTHYCGLLNVLVEEIIIKTTCLPFGTKHWEK